MPKTIIYQEAANRAAGLLLDIDALSIRFDPPFVFTTGLKSPIYLDNRVVMSHPAVRAKIIELYVEAIRKFVGIENVDCISATATAAIPHGSWIAGMLNLPMVFVRPTTKKHGKGNRLEGYLKKGSRVVIIEDHISTAESVVNNAKTIRSHGGIVTYCLATSTYETRESETALYENKIQLIALTTGRHLIAEANKRGIVTVSQKKLIDLWFDNPKDWGKTVKTEGLGQIDS